MSSDSECGGDRVVETVWWRTVSIWCPRKVSKQTDGCLHTWRRPVSRWKPSGDDSRLTKTGVVMSKSGFDSACWLSSSQADAKKTVLHQ